MATSDAVLDVGRRGRDAVFQLLARTVAMRVITLLGTVILARVLSPADFGVYAVLLVWMVVLGLIGDSGVAASLIQQPAEPTDEEIATAWTTQQLLWIPLVLGTWLLAPLLPTLVPSLGPDFGWQLSVVAIAIPLAILRTVPMAMMTRNLRFGALATIETVMHVCFYGVAVTGALVGAGTWSFAAAIVAQAATGALLANLVWRRRPVLMLRPSIARRQLGFGLAFTSATIAFVGRDGVVALFGGLAGGVAAIGQLQFSFRVGHLAATFDDVIARVTFPAYSRLQHDTRRIARLTRDAVLVTGLAISAVQVWLIGSAPALVPVVFGDQWLPAIPAIQLVCLGTLATTPTRFLRSLVFGQGRSRTGLLLSVATSGALAITFPLLVLSFGLAGGGLAFAIAGLFGLWVHVRAVRDVAPFPWADLARLYGLAGAAGTAGWLVAMSVSGLAGLVASSAVFALLGLVLVAAFARPELTLAWRLVRGRPAASPAADAELAGAILAADGAPPVRDPGAGAHQRPGR